MHTSYVPSDNSFQRYNLCFLHEYRASIYLVLVFADLLWHFIDIRGHDVIGNDMGEFMEPEERDLGQKFPLVWDALLVDETMRELVCYIFNASAHF